MTPDDRKAFLETVIGFAELKGKTLSAHALELYWRALQHWPLADFRQAAEQLLRTCEYMPTPKHFEDLRKAGRPTSGEAWAVALECGRKGRETCGDRLIDAAVKAIGGYGAIGRSEVSKTQFLERAFCEHFDTMQDAEDIREAVPQIAYSGGARQLKGPTSAAALLSRDPR